MLLETWFEIEMNQQGAESTFATQVKEKMPIKVKKRRPLANNGGDNPETATQEGGAEMSQAILIDENEDVDMTGWEEFYDYVFPDDEKTGKGKGAKNLKLLEMARKWKKQEEGAQ